LPPKNCLAKSCTDRLKIMKCQTCQSEISGHKRRYCNPKCYPSFTPKSSMGLTECQVCSKPLDENIGKGRPKRNCSNRCRVEARSRTLRAKNIRTVNCANCQKDFLGNRPSARFCSTECRLIVSRIEGNERAKKRVRQGLAGSIRTTPCGWCQEPRDWEIGKSVVTAYHPKCTIEARRARYRIKTVKRQSQIEKPSRLAADEVVRMYGSDCAVCGKPIDLTLKRTSAMGLTVDHWIPLSKGGSDDITNLRPAHWTCNRKKSDKLPKELNA
jgi:5-methylcytosine-specific restriction endonuclease McrA